MCLNLVTQNTSTAGRISNYGLQSSTAITTDFQQAHIIPVDIATPAGAPWIVVGTGRRHGRRRQRKQKWGCRAGLLCRFRKHPLPSILLTNGRSIRHKVNAMEFLITNSKSVQDCCVIIIIESRLHPDMPNAVVQ